MEFMLTSVLHFSHQLNVLTLFLAHVTPRRSPSGLNEMMMNHQRVLSSYQEMLLQEVTNELSSGLVH
jgi:hypothetical protein